jgi:hypothetical protein
MQAVTDSLTRIVITGDFETYNALIAASAVDIDHYVSWFRTVFLVVATDGDMLERSSAWRMASIQIILSRLMSASRLWRVQRRMIRSKSWRC